MPDQPHYSPHRVFFCVFQHDCNFVVYRAADMLAVWASNPRPQGFGFFGGKGWPGRLPVKLCMQHDRNLVTYTTYPVPCWSSNTHGQGVPGGRVILDDDGHLRIHDGNGTLLWTS